MESTNIQALTGTSVVATRDVVRQDAVRPDAIRTPEKTNEADNQGRRASALGVFRAELRQSLQAFFRLRFNVSPPGYSDASANADEAAGDALSAAGRLVDEAPTRASKALISFRASVKQAAEFARQLVADDSTSDVDDAVSKVNEGLDALDEKAASNREVAASVLDVDMRTRQRSSIRIRTQEGDVVTFRLRRSDSLSASDVSVTDGQTSVSTTEVQVSSRSRMMLSVKGDLNESEFAAIQNVFSQAEEMANQFFGGDIGAAFNSAQAFEFDSEQLARVNMRFRLNQVTRVSQTEVRQSTDALPITERLVGYPDAEPVSGPRPGELPRRVAVPPAESLPIDRTPPPDADNNPVASEAATPASAAVSTPVPSLPDALTGFFDLLSDFLRSVGEGFESGQSLTDIRLHYAESFKLNLLKAVIHTVAPNNSASAADNAAPVIDAATNAIEADRGDQA